MSWFKGKLSKLEIHKLNQQRISPWEFITHFYEEMGNEKLIPSPEYLRALKGLEPILSETGRRNHYIHMFNVLLLGNVILDRLFQNNELDNLQKYWLIIATSHDISYPLEAIEEELKTFMEKYFHIGSAPKMLFGKELYLSYGDFLHYMNLIEEGYEMIAKNNTKEIFEALFLYNLVERSDHAIISAFLTMKFIDKNYKNTIKVNNIEIDKNNFLKVVGTTICLHNLHNWKFHSLKDLYLFLKYVKDSGLNGNIITKDKAREIAEKCGLFVFLYGKRKDKSKTIEMLDPLRNFIDLEFNYEIFEDYILKYLVNPISNIKIDTIKLNNDLTETDELKFLVFLLSLTDILQEWGREASWRGVKPLSIREVTNSESILKISITSPYARSSKGRTLPVGALQFKEDNFWYIKKRAIKEHWKIPEIDHACGTSFKNYKVNALDEIDKFNDSMKKLDTKIKGTLSKGKKIEASQYSILKTYFNIRDKISLVYDANKKVQIEFQHVFDNDKKLIKLEI